MQATSNEIYSAVSLLTGVDQELVKAVGDTVFSSISSHMRQPTSLILKIKGLGSFILRKKKIVQEVERIDRKIAFPYRVKFETDEEALERKRLLMERLEEYERYFEKRAFIKKIRHANQKIIQPSVQEEDI